MKRQLCLCLVLLSFAFIGRAAQSLVDIRLWKGGQECTDDWKGWQQVTADKCALAAEGDEIVINVSTISPTCQWPQVMLNNSSWSSLGDAKSFLLTGQSAPTTATFTLTPSMVTEMKAGGFIIKGCGYTFSEVILRHKIENGGTEEKGNAVTTLWKGSEIISWTKETSNWVKVDAAKFSAAKVGNKLRMSFSHLGISCQGRIIGGNWKAFTGVKNTSPLKGNYFEYEITDDMLQVLKTQGLIVSGIGYTLTQVDIVDPHKEYNILAQYAEDDIRAWEAGEEPKLGMTLTNLESVQLSVSYVVDLTKDMVDDQTGTHSPYLRYATDVILAPGETKTVDLPFTDLKTPGFYNMTATVNDNCVCAYTIGYDPTGILSPDDAQTDFWPYWNKALEELAGVKPEYTLVQEMLDKSTVNRKVYLVSMKSVPDTRGGRPVTIRGYYAEPVADGVYPTLIQYLGTDGGTSVPYCMSGDDNPGWCEFILSVRGQMLNNRPPYKEDNIYGNDYYSYGWGNLEEHYYRGAYLDCVRAVDFLKSRAKVDTDNIFAFGGSQGGCFTYVAAGLSGAFRAIAPSITGHADFVDGMKIVDWPRAKFLAAQKRLNYTDEQRDVFNSYFDVKNFSSHITCPVITNFSLQDRTDPPHTNIAPYNLLTSVGNADKTFCINPYLGHGTPASWNATFMAFFRKYLTSTNVVAAPKLTLNGSTLTTGSYSGLLHSGDKVMVSVEDGCTLYTSWGTSSSFETAESLAIDKYKMNTKTKSMTTLVTGSRTLYAVAKDAGGKLSDMVVVSFTDITFPVTISSPGWRTFSAPYTSLDFSSAAGLAAYVVSDIKEGKAILKSVTTAPKGTGLILKGAEGTYYLSGPLAPPVLSETNLLVATNGSEYTTAEGDYYMGRKGTSLEIGLVKSNGERNIPSGKAYIPSSAVFGAKGFLSLEWEGMNPTGISDIRGDEETKDSFIYNISGQRVNDGYRGVVVRDGKKVMIK